MRKLIYDPIKNTSPKITIMSPMSIGIRRGRSNAPQQVVEDFSAFPRYSFVETPLAISFREVLIDTALMVIFGLVFFMGSYMSFLRYPLAG